MTITEEFVVTEVVDDAAPAFVNIDEVPPSFDDAPYRCEDCGAPLTYGGKGRKPRVCSAKNGGVCHKTGRQRAPRAMSPKSASIAKGIADLYRMVGLGVAMFDQHDGMVITDGAPADANAVKETIRAIAATLTNGEEFGIIFLTVGQIDSSLRAFLTELDDTLNAKHDIVDVKDFMEVDFLAAFSGAVND